MKNSIKGHLFIISGPSGVGKGVICERLQKQNDKLWLSVSLTTREMRVNERDGVHYSFISEKEFKERINNNELLEYDLHFGTYYGTPKKAVEEHLNNGIDVILEIDVNGSLKVMKTYPQAVFIFISPPSMKELERRMNGRRTETEEQKAKRLERAIWEMNQTDKYNYVIVNDKLDDAINEIQEIIDKKKTSK